MLNLAMAFSYHLHFAAVFSEGEQMQAGLELKLVIYTFLNTPKRYEFRVFEKKIKTLTHVFSFDFPAVGRCKAESR